MTVAASTDPTSGGSVISLPSGGGAIGGLGEKFSPDLFTGTGNFTVPIALPAGGAACSPGCRWRTAPANGNGLFGLGWALGMPGVSRKTSHGVPRYRDMARRTVSRPTPSCCPVAEDLVPVAGGLPGSGALSPAHRGPVRPDRARPRRDGRLLGGAGSGRDGYPLRHATPDLRPPAGATGRRRRPGEPGAGLRVVDHRDDRPVRQRHPLHVRPRPGGRAGAPLGPAADRRGSTTPTTATGPIPRSWPRSIRLRAAAGPVLRLPGRVRDPHVAAVPGDPRSVTHAADGVDRAVREYRFAYEQAPFNGVSLLDRVDVVGVDDTPAPPQFEELPPLTFGYTRVRPARRRFSRSTGAGPADQRRSATRRWRSSTSAATGLPDIVELGTAPRYWRNRRRRPVRPARGRCPRRRRIARRAGRAAARRRRRRPGRPARHLRRRSRATSR